MQHAKGRRGNRAEQQTERHGARVAECSRRQEAAGPRHRQTGAWAGTEFTCQVVAIVSDVGGAAPADGAKTASGSMPIDQLNNKP